MNNEKRNHPPDLLAGEERVSQLYQATSKETPPLGLDATILDAARQTAHRKSRRVYFLASRKWAVPLSLAAAFVVTIGVVRSLRHEIESPEMRQLPAISQPAIAPPLDNWENLKPRAQELSQAKEASPAVDHTLTPLGKMAEADSKRFSLPSAPALSAPAEQQERRSTPQFQVQEPSQAIPPPVSPSPSSASAPSRLVDQGKTNLGAIAAKPQPQTSEQERALQALAPRDEAAGVSSLRVSEDDLRSVEERKEKAKAEMVKKDTLSPKDWIAEIKKLRQAGKRAEAEASLKAFKQRYPDYPVEKALALPNTSHNVPKGTR